MITRTPSWDYNRTPKPPSPEMRALEQVIVAWINDLMKYEKRGLITPAEFVMLIDKCPVPKEFEHVELT